MTIKMLMIGLTSHCFRYRTDAELESHRRTRQWEFDSNRDIESDRASRKL